MIRTKQNKKPSAILTGDWHIREDVPECRTDDFWSEQWRKIDFIADLQHQYRCPVWHSGDLFNKWNPSLYLVAETIKHLPEDFCTIFGNHDLPQHSLDLSHKCGINLLEKAGRLKVLNGTHWNQTPETNSRTLDWYANEYTTPIHRNILIYHVMTYTGKLPWPDCPAPNAQSLLKKYPQYDLILTGHNHKRFTAELNGRLLVNPGSIMRQTADQEDFSPCVWLWYAESNTVEPIYIPISEGVISREHIARKEQRDGRIDAFVKRLDTDWEGGVSFEENLERLLAENEIKNEVKSIIYKAMES